MGLFDRFRGKKNAGDFPPNGEVSAAENTQGYSAPVAAARGKALVPLTELSLEPGNLQHLISACLGPSHVRQMAFAEQVARNLNWSLNLSTGQIQFGERAFSVQLLGSESYESKTWLWCWSNRYVENETIQVQAKQLCGMLASLGYPHLTQGELPCDDALTGHTLAAIAAALSPGNSCYYRCPYEGGAAFVLVENLPDSVFAPITAQAFLEAIQTLILRCPLDHRVLARSMARLYAPALQESANALSGYFPDGTPVQIDFDAMHRISRCSVLRTK